MNQLFQCSLYVNSNISKSGEIQAQISIPSELRIMLPTQQIGSDEEHKSCTTKISRNDYTKHSETP